MHNGEAGTRAGRFLVPAVSLLVVAIVAISFFGIHGSSPRGKTASGGLVELVYEALPNPPGSAVTRGTLERTVEIMQPRLRCSMSSWSASVRYRHDRDHSASAQRHRHRAGRAGNRNHRPAVGLRLEANVLAPNGKTVASQLQERNPTALKISQESGSLADLRGRNIGLYQAVLLASEQPENPNPANSRVGQQYFMFERPVPPRARRRRRRTARCRRPVSTACCPGQPTTGLICFLDSPGREHVRGPDPDRAAGNRRAPGDLLSSAPPVAFSDNDPSAQFFVLKDNVALRGSDITNPQPSTDPNSRKPDITFGVTSKGKTAFQSMTAVVARRGDQLSGPGQTLNQHFAVAFDSQLIAVPYIDYKIYPHGVTAYGADLSSGLTAASTRSLATALRLGALPLNLKLICRAPAATACHMPSVR